MEQLGGFPGPGRPGWNSTKTYSQLGTISADFAFTKTGSAGGYSYIGIYGWSENPLHEYYIVEDWFGNGSPNLAAPRWAPSRSMGAPTTSTSTRR